MKKAALFLTFIFCSATSSAQAQVIVTRLPVVTTYYAPAIAPPIISAPVITYYVPSVTVPAPIVAYAAPTIIRPSLPVTTFYAPAPVVVPAITVYRLPTVAAPVVGTPVIVRRITY